MVSNLVIIAKLDSTIPSLIFQHNYVRTLATAQYHIAKINRYTMYELVALKSPMLVVTSLVYPTK